MLYGRNWANIIKIPPHSGGDLYLVPEVGLVRRYWGSIAASPGNSKSIHWILFALRDVPFESRLSLINIKKSPWLNTNSVSGASGDTELFEKASNINGFQGGRVANNLYISPFRATVFQTAALFLYPNSSAVIGVENLRFLSLWLAF